MVFEKHAGATQRGRPSSADLGIESRLRHPDAVRFCARHGPRPRAVRRARADRQFGFSKPTPTSSKSSQASPRFGQMFQRKKLGLPWVSGRKRRENYSWLQGRALRDRAQRSARCRQLLRERSHNSWRKGCNYDPGASISAYFHLAQTRLWNRPRIAKAAPDPAGLCARWTTTQQRAQLQ
jgi:hypothetical protein